LLDVGCAEGHFGEFLIAERGIEVWGVEPNPEAAERARTRLPMVVNGAYPDDVDQSAKFDCVTLNDVLEHMTNPAEALIAVARQLTAGGCVVASVPNIRHIEPLSALAFHGRWDYQDWGILDRTHLRFFTKSTMRELFENCGFEVLLQQPSFWSRPTGKWRILRLRGSLGEEMSAVQYLIVAKPR
jgi:2-polyprenyl-3-methyl-5-hydroxy-6-metoxy-1,4-benzoquinol methylase